MDNDIYNQLIQARSEVRYAYWKNLREMRQARLGGAETEAYQKLNEEFAHVIGELNKRIEAFNN